MGSKFRRKVFWTIFGCGYGIFILHAVATGAVFVLTNDSQQRAYLKNVIATSGFTKKQQPFGKKNVFPNPVFRDTGFFYVEADRSGKILNVRPERFENTSRAEVNNKIREINKQSAAFGKVGNFKFLVEHNDKFTFYALLDMTAYDAKVRDSFRTHAVILIFLLFAEVLIALVASHYIMEIFGQAIELQQRFVANASHEIRTPLTSILANVGVLELELDENKWLSSIKFEVNQLKRLSDELFVMAHIGDKDFEMRKEKFNLSEELTNLAISFESRAIQERRNFIWNIEPGLRINGFSEKIQQLVAILLDNAVKYSEERGRITLELTAKGKTAMLSVHNTGKGVPNSERDKIFQRFYRADKSRTSGSNGFGLGLSIAAEIAAMHKSYIYVDGEEGKWIKFYLSLELA